MMRWLPAASAAVTTIIMIAIAARDYPLIGHDYRYFIPRLIDTDLHIRINGLAVQWFTPTFGSGLPAFPNPQHIQYSLSQALTLWVGPWHAVLLTTVLVTLAGFWCFYRLARGSFELSAAAATLGALFFIGNGFSIERLIVGHVGFQLFPLLAVLVWAVVDRRWRAWTRGSLAAIVIAASLYHGGFLLIILGGLSVAVCVPVIVLFRPDLLERRNAIRTAAIALAGSVIIAAPKVLSVLLLMRQFPRQVADQTVIPLPQAIVGLVAQLAGVEAIVPIFALASVDVARVEGALIRLTGTNFGLWELDASLSPVLFVCLALGAIHAWRHGNAIRWRPHQRAAAVALLIAIWILVEAALARGIVYPLIKSLPVFSALHVNPRLAGVFVLPLAITAAMLIDPWLKVRPASAGALLIVLACLSPLPYFWLPARLHARTYDVSRAEADHAAVRQGERFEIERLAKVSDGEAIALHASSLQPYDPLLGYSNEFFKPLTREGDVRVATDGYWNMTHPASLVFADLNGLQPFERIRVDDRERLEAFLSRRQPDWQIPGILRILNVVALLTLLACIATVAIGVGSRRE